MEYISSGENRSGMFNNRESVISDEPRETAIDIMSNLSGILTEIKNQVDLIDAAIYGKRVEDAIASDEKPQRPPMLMILRQQRDFAESILKSIVHIREGLWG